MQRTVAKRWYNNGGLFLYHFIRSNYITALWNWFMGLAGKAAEPVLFASVLYSGYQLVPGVPVLSPGMNALAFVTQQAALDIGGMGLIKLTKDEDPTKCTFARRIGVALIALMVINMIVATSGKVFTIPVPAMQFVEGLLLIVRSVFAVLFGHAIHTLKDEKTGENVEPRVDAIVSQALVYELQDLRAAQEAHRADLQQQLADMKVQSFIPPMVQESVQERVTDPVQYGLQDFGWSGVQEETQESVQSEVQDEVAPPLSNLVDLSARICARQSESLSASESCTDKLSQVKGRRSHKVPSGNDVTRKVHSILRKTPKTTAATLAEKLGISESYASKLKAQFNKEQEEGA
jgi:hypothetical protein